MLSIDKTTFETEVLKSKCLVFVDFWSPSCEPCLELLPDVEAFAQKNEGRAKFCKLDSGSNKRLAISQKVMGLPTFAFYKNGEKVAVFSKDEIDMNIIQAKLDELLA